MPIPQIKHSFTVIADPYLGQSRLITKENEKTSIRFHNSITNFFLSFFNKTLDIQDANGQIYHLNRGSTINWLSSHKMNREQLQNLDSETLAKMINQVLDNIEPKEPIGPNTEKAIESFAWRLGSREAYLNLPILDLSTLGYDEINKRPIWVGDTNLPDSIPLSAVKAPVMRGTNVYSGCEHLIIKYATKDGSAVWVMAEGKCPCHFVSCKVRESGNGFRLDMAIDSVTIRKSEEQINQLNDEERKYSINYNLSWTEKFRLLMQTGKIEGENLLGTRNVQLDGTSAELNEYFAGFEKPKNDKT